MILDDLSAAIAAEIRTIPKLTGAEVKIFDEDEGDLEQSMDAALNDGLVILVRMISGKTDSPNDPSLEQTTAFIVRIAEVAIINRDRPEPVTVRAAGQLIMAALHHMQFGNATIVSTGWGGGPAESKERTVQILDASFETRVCLAVDPSPQPQE